MQEPAPQSAATLAVDVPAHPLSAAHRLGSLFRPGCYPRPFGSPLELSRVHWVRPQVVVEVTYLAWTEGGLLRAVSYQGERQDRLARQVVRIPSAGTALNVRATGQSRWSG